MTQYLFAVHHPEGDVGLTEEEIEQSMKETGVFNEELKASGAWVFAGGLHPPSTATVVRSKNGEVVTTDGPYTETKEQLGGFWIIEAPDLDAALKLAAEASEVCRQAVEVRPFMD
jgi:hypothetical protein